MSDALEAARRTLRDYNPRDALTDDVVMARALLSFAQGREQLAGTFEQMLQRRLDLQKRAPNQHNEGWIDALEHVVGITRLNSLPSKEGWDG